MIIRNPGIHGLNAQRLLWMFKTLYMTAYQPLGWLAYAVIIKLRGLDAYAFHLVSLCLHVLVVLSFFSVSRALFKAAGQPRFEFPSLAAALFFAIHPLQVATVAWATEIPDQMASLFFLLSILIYLSGRSKSRLIASWLLFLLSGLCRWKGIALPLILLVLDFYPLRRLRPSPRDPLDWKNREVWREKLPFAFLALAILFINTLAKTTSGYNPAFQPAVISRGLWLFFWKTINPSDILGLYALHDVDDYLQMPGILSSSLLILTGVALWKFRRRVPTLTAAGVCYAALLLPPLLNSQEGVVLVYTQYSYLAGLAFYLSGAAGLRLLSDAGSAARRAAWISCLALAAALIGSSRRQSRHWSDDVAFWTHTIAVDQKAWVAFPNLGGALAARGRLNDAYFYQMIQTNHNPGDDIARRTMASLLKDIHSKPDKVLFWIGTAQNYLALGRTDEARTLCGRAVQKKPDLPQAHDCLAAVAAARGDMELAHGHWALARRGREKTARKQPSGPRAFSAIITVP